MAVGHHPDPDRHGDDAQDARHPGGREALGEDRGRTVEGAPPEQQHAQHQHEQARFLEVETLEERGEDAGHQQPERDVVGGLHAAEQRARQDQQTQADDAAGQMRDLEHGERQELVEEREPLVDRRCRAREQQQRAGEEGQGAGDLRHDRRDVHAGELVGAGQCPALRWPLPCEPNSSVPKTSGTR